MEIKAKLNKPYTDKQRVDFIVENNHNKGFIIEETEEGLLAVYNEPTVAEQNEAIRQARANAYAVEVDPITAHIQRLKDQDPVPTDEIAELIAERDAKVIEIKTRYPYAKEVIEDGLQEGWKEEIN